jgi:amino acid adenylation domain-containing protein
MANQETSQLSYLPSDILLRVERIAATYPEIPAAHFANATLNYGEINAGSRLLAARLRENGLESGAVVCVCLPAGPECLMALLAIFRIGGIYVPVNPDHPKKYLEDIITQASPSLVITQRKILNSVLPSTIGSICCDDLALECDDSVPLSVSSPDAPAAILFTSGSTGKPKGVLLTCENLAHLAAAAHDVVELESSDVFCNIARNTFSISFFDLLVPITLGASIRFVSRDTLFDFDALVREIKCSTVMHAGPALLSALHRHLESAGGLGDSGLFGHMRHVSTGGDMVLPSVMTKMKQLFPQAELFVFYGCTEIACMGTFHQFAKRSQPENIVHTESGRAVQTESGRAIVGRPFPGMEVFLIGEDQEYIERNESGTVGEIVFAGRGVAAGYLNQKEQTIRQFGTSPADPKVRSYRTGDFGRWTSGGSLEILGRRDFQVQVRGVRVELAAIENRIIEMGIGTQCIVMERFAEPSAGSLEPLVSAAGEEKILIAFIVARGNDQADLSANSIGAALSQEFPREMIPSRFHFLHAMPLNHNGKIDRKALASMELPPASATPSVMSSLETGIAAVFKEELGLSEIGTDDIFLL